MQKDLLIGKIIKYIRINSNLTQQQLADKIFIGRSTLSDYEREKTDINFELINKICTECGYQIIFKNKDEEITIKNINRLI